MAGKSRLEKLIRNEIRRMRFVNQILIDRIEYLEDKIKEQEQNTAVILQHMTEHMIYLHKKLAPMLDEINGDGIDPIMHEGIESDG